MKVDYQNFENYSHEEKTDAIIALSSIAIPLSDDQISFVENYFIEARNNFKPLNDKYSVETFQALCALGESVNEEKMKQILFTNHIFVACLNALLDGDSLNESGFSSKNISFNSKNTSIGSHPQNPLVRQVANLRKEKFSSGTFGSLGDINLSNILESPLSSDSALFKDQSSFFSDVQVTKITDEQSLNDQPLLDNVGKDAHVTASKTDKIQLIGAFGLGVILTAAVTVGVVIAIELYQKK